MATATEEQRGALIGIAAVVACLPGVATVPAATVREYVDAMVKGKPGDEDEIAASAFRMAQEILAAARLFSRYASEAGQERQQLKPAAIRRHRPKR
jgi:hypothetical protein